MPQHVQEGVPLALCWTVPSATLHAPFEYLIAPTLHRYELEENPTVCACMEATAELFLADGFEPAPQEGGEGQQEAAAGQQLGGEALPLPRPEPPRVVIEEID